jgi:hypothetical protein
MSQRSDWLPTGREEILAKTWRDGKTMYFAVTVENGGKQGSAGLMVSVLIPQADTG